MVTLNCKGTLLAWDSPVVMGVINVTNNSFYAAGRHRSIEQILATAAQMLQDGAAILDVGGQSTHPESAAVTAFAEMERVVPAIKAIKEKFPQSIVSIDTYFAEVAKAAVDAGADMVNDVGAGTLDAKMLETVAALGVPYIAMHIKGTPQTMKNQTHYENMIREILDYFIRKIDECGKAGVKDVIIDPGFGFAKNTEQNFELMKRLSVFKMLGKPLLIGISRKKMIYETLHITPENALNGSSVLHTFALQNGADIIRTHDVKQAMEAIVLLKKLGVV